jgi:hypothetical protein
MSIQEHPDHRAVESAHLDRRRSARLEVLGRIQGELRALDLPITVLNVSQGGFLMQAPLDFPLGGSHDFRFTAPGREPIVLTAHVVHVMSAIGAGSATYLLGLEFEQQDTAAREIATLLGFLDD